MNKALIEKLFARVYLWEEMAGYASEHGGTESIVLSYLTKRDAGMQLFSVMGLLEKYLFYRDERKRKEEVEEDEESRD